ncbi:DUF6292 family protein [Actinophytocola sp. NPDC049390]|uniref:DUF6292 family protein n=1 Tax=Actinophytocola sp. NPDC049390 TaxID=3363894 RepID=UPI0037A12438
MKHVWPAKTCWWHGRPGPAGPRPTSELAGEPKHPFACFPAGPAPSYAACLACGQRGGAADGSRHGRCRGRGVGAYVEAVAVAVGVEAAASWSEYGPPSSGYVALSESPPGHPKRLLMPQWSSEEGWSLAVEPERIEPPVVLATWPVRVRPAPSELAVEMRQILTKFTRDSGRANRSIGRRVNIVPR